MWFLDCLALGLLHLPDKPAGVGESSNPGDRAHALVSMLIVALMRLQVKRKLADMGLSLGMDLNQVAQMSGGDGEEEEEEETEKAGAAS